MSTTKSKPLVIDPGLCRCCGELKKCRFLNEEYDYAGTKEVYADIMMDCFGLLLSHLDGKPLERLVCATCVVRLREASCFKRQVLRAEEAFLAMKIMYHEGDSEVVVKEDAPSLPGLDAVKLEPQFPGTPRSPPAPAVADDDSDRDYTEESDRKVEVTITPTSAPPPPPPRRQKRRQPAPGASGNKIVERTKKEAMLRLQQKNRERDVNYTTETNIASLVECSYVCPFKCRHNNLICFYCGILCTEPEVLRTHTISEHNPKKFKITQQKKMIKMDITRIDCRLCDEKIYSLESLKLHITKVHRVEYYFDYPDSVLPFRLTKGELSCALCELKYPYFHALNKHMNVHFSNYVCETCGLGFVDKCRFDMHLQRHEDGDFPCPTCGKNFRAQYNRDLHIDRVHKKKGRVYCPKCDVMLMSYPQKLKHLMEVHGDEPMSFPCGLCSKVCMTRRMLTIHKRKDHLKDYRYECQYCGQKFFTRFALTNHMPTHTGERNFKCKVCEKTYPRLKTLKDHMRIHTNDRRYRCHICGQAFIQNCSLKAHLKSQHPEYG
ncbi:zinc finger protein 260 [Plutella xylostella]|uniref:zinc finger protein 260 n=1 Tax=Plutella xylostella TaxID=51655 RepID=UPI002032C652|nr:zinc finger protein 260 [Plutella xylostella]